MHICFCISAIGGGGGAERALATLLSLLRRDGVRVSLLTLEAADAPTAFALPDIRIERLDILGGRGLRRLRNLASRRREIGRGIERIGPDIVVSFMDTMNVAVLIATRGSGRPVVISERTDPAHHALPGWKRLMRRLTYPQCDRLVVQTHRVAAFFAWMDPRRIAVIANAAPQDGRLAAPCGPNRQGRHSIVAVGRLSHEKRFGLLIRAFGRLTETHPDWDLVIYGDGQERQSLVATAADLGIGSRVFLPGWRTDIGEALAESHIMAVPSRYEGFPNALAEAAAAGLPSVGFSGVSGVEDIILDGKTGFLVDPAKPEEGLAAALDTLMAAPARRKIMGMKARAHARRWTPERIMGEWLSLFHELHGSSEPRGQ